MFSWAVARVRAPLCAVAVSEPLLSGSFAGSMGLPED